MTPTSVADRRQARQTLVPTIFVVNNDESARTWIEATIVSSGLHALGFNTAADLLSRFDANTAACAILDLILPDADVFELQGQLARAGVSILFVTRERCFASCVRAIKAGAIDFLTLPCDAAQLVQSLHRAAQEASVLWNQRVQFGELHSRYEQLTEREREVFALVSSGLRNKQIAQRLDISEITVQIHRGRVMRKMSARSFASLVRMADTLRRECWAH